MMTLKAMRACPVCGGFDCDFIYRQKFILPEGHPLSGGYDVVLCDACGFVYANTTATQMDIDVLYSSQSKYGNPGTSTGGGALPWDQERLEMTAERIAQYIPKRESRILDIGCGGGGLLEDLRRIGYGNLDGLDPSRACVEQLRRRGIQGYEGTVCKVPSALGAASFDCVILLHVLEHLLIPKDAVSAARHLLKPGGLLYVEVPDASRYEAFVTAPFQEFNTEHLNHFSHKSLYNLFCDKGFTERSAGRAIIHSSADTLYPIIYAFYEKTDFSGNVPQRHEDSLIRPIIKYIQESEKIMARIEAYLQEVLQDNPEIILWGAGQLAMKLLGKTCLANARIAAIVDSNPVVYGQRLNGIMITAPESIRGLGNFPILIASLLHETEITAVIRQSLGLDNPIWTLLPRADSTQAFGRLLKRPDTLQNLEELLVEDPAEARQREAAAFSDWLSMQKGPLFLFGAGELGRKVLECLRDEGIEPAGFVDNDSAKQGKAAGGMLVLPPGKAVRKFPGASFIITIRSPGHGYREIRRQLINAGCDCVLPVVPILWRYPERLLPHYGLDLPSVLLAQATDIKRTFSILADEESRRLFTALLKLKLWADFKNLPHPSPDDQYFAEGVVRFTSGEFFVDCGAFNGDTIRSFLARRGDAFRHILAFEPDPANVTELRRYVGTLPARIRGRITMRQEAVGACRAIVRFDSNRSGRSSVCPEGNIEVPSVPLDEILGGKQPNFLKLDVEGAERDALAGARTLIQRERPRLAVCVYHRPDDLWRIPLDLHGLDVGYRFHLRAHQDDGLDTVLYAIPGGSL